jgi:hypothetical protein
VILALAVGCGSSASDGGTTTRQNIFTGALSITSALPGGSAACGVTHTVTFSAAGADVHTVSAAGGDCVTFVNADAAMHQPASIPLAGCPELNAPAPLAQSGTFTTAPLAGPKACNWQDLLNPPGTPGGTGGGY